MAPLVIFGASRGVGLELARLARHGGRPVVALVRDGSPHSELDAAGVMVVTGDVLDPQAVSVACAAAGGPFDLVSTVGGRTADGRFTDEWGNIAAVDAAAAGPCRRLVLVTSMGCGEMAPFRSERAIAAFGAAVDAKTRAEDHMRRAFPRGTAIRPGGLRSEPATGRGILSADPEIHGFIHRADVAELVLRALDDAATEGRFLAAVDADQARSVHPVEPFPLKPRA